MKIELQQAIKKNNEFNFILPTIIKAINKKEKELYKKYKELNKKNKAIQKEKETLKKRYKILQNKIIK